MTKQETMDIIQNAIKHWLKPSDSGVLALHIGKEKTFVDIEWADGVSMFDCDKVLALVKKKQKISKDDLFDFCR